LKTRAPVHRGHPGIIYVYYEVNAITFGTPKNKRGGTFPESGPLSPSVPPLMEMETGMETGTMIFVFCLILTAFVLPAAHAEEDCSVPLVYELLPGGTHFYTGDRGKGFAFLAAEVSLFAAGALLDRRETGGLNVPFILSGQVYAIDKYEYSRRSLGGYFGATHGDDGARFTPSSLSGLMTAPFRKETVLSPFVLCWAILGIADGIAAYPAREGSWKTLTSARMYGGTFDRAGGTFVYESSAALLSWGAAVSEEMLFRGLLLPVFDRSFGKRAGLVASSLVFGMMHLFNSDIDRPVYFIGQATAAGFAYGGYVQRHGYRLERVIAAHFWYDFVSMTTTWLMNPRENPLGVGVGFAF